MQVLWLSFVMIPLYALNQQLVYATFKALDVGGSISIHAFGAYYGLAASLVLSRCALASAHVQSWLATLMLLLSHQDAVA